MRLRWDRPIQATLEVNGPFNGLPRLPFQLAATALRIPEFIRTLRIAALRAHGPPVVKRGRPSSG